MPIIKSAKKKLHQDQKRYAVNRITLNKMKQAVRLATIEPKLKNIQTAYSAIDSAAKKKVIAKNTAARLKSKVSRKINSKKI